MQPLLIFLVSLVVVFGIGLALSVYRINGLKSANEYLEDARYEATQDALDAEKRAGVAETEAQFAKQTILSILHRPAVAQFTEENIQQLGAMVQSFMVKPGGMN